MTTMRTSKLPVVDRHDFQSTIYGRSCTSWGRRRTLVPLPGIGTYTIDGPRDDHMGVRQQCQRYQEAHRGVIRSRIESLPDIPKRCGMKSIPVVQLRESHDMATSPINIDHDDRTSPDSFTCTDVRIDQHENKHRKMDRKSLKKQDSSSKLLTQEELFSRSPIGRMFGGCSEWKPTVPVAGFGVRKSKLKGVPTMKKEYTNLSVNVELAEQGPAPCKATDRELMSQAEYRKQLTFYLNQFENEERRDGSEGDALESCRSAVLNHPADNIGHTSKHRNWATNVCLGEVLINSTTCTPDLKRKLACSGSQGQGLGKERTRLQCGHSLKFNTPVNDEYEDEDEEAWLSMVNTPLVDRGVYDRYANVKLPPSRHQHRGRSSK